MTIRTLLITDTETGGLDPSTCPTVEVACILYDVKHRTIVESFASLLRGASNDAQAINRIDPASLAAAPTHEDVWGRVRELVRRADALGPAAYMAHRAEFDRGFYPSNLRDLLPWICSKYDCEWPLSKPGDSCVGMALAHGVPVTSVHRAMTDALLIARTLERVQELGYDLTEILTRAMRPKARYVAQVSYDDREKAKAAGFSWDGATKTWSRTMAKEDVGALGFSVREIAS